MNGKHDSLLGWTMGFITSGTGAIVISPAMTDFLLKFVITMTLGFVGGFAGLAGKWVFSRIVKKNSK